MNILRKFVHLFGSIYKITASLEIWLPESQRQHKDKVQEHAVSAMKIARNKKKMFNFRLLAHALR